jgi:hypothetical protein
MKFGPILPMEEARGLLSRLLSRQGLVSQGFASREGLAQTLHC